MGEELVQPSKKLQALPMKLFNLNETNSQRRSSLSPKKQRMKQRPSTTVALRVKIKGVAPHRRITLVDGTEESTALIRNLVKINRGFEMNKIIKKPKEYLGSFFQSGHSLNTLNSRIH